MRLIAANLLLVAAVLVHTLDHLRQERGIGGVDTAVIVGGNLVVVLAVVSLVLTARRHPWAAPFAIAVGAWVAVGVTASHFLPEWSALSDPYAGLGLDVLSWLAAGFEVVAGAVLAVAGVLARRRVVAV